ncbi:MAG: calcium-binding protein [Pseudomonadota bacterium]
MKDLTKTLAHDGIEQPAFGLLTDGTLEPADSLAERHGAEPRVDDSDVREPAGPDVTRSGDPEASTIDMAPTGLRSTDDEPERRESDFKVLHSGPGWQIADAELIWAVVNNTPEPVIGDADYTWGTFGDDFMVGTNGADFLVPIEGNDIVHGGDGNDLIVELTGHNSLYGDAGIDAIIGGDQTDEIFGGLDNDILRGKEGDDFLSGDHGDDWLTGGEGEDDLLGGAGADTFYWAAMDDDGGKDDILDFELGIDSLYFTEDSGGQSYFAPHAVLSDVIIALDNGANTEILVNHHSEGWLVVADIHNIDHLDVQAAIDDGSILGSEPWSEFIY